MQLVVDKFSISECGKFVDIDIHISDENYSIRRIYIDNQSTYPGSWTGYPSDHPLYVEEVNTQHYAKSISVDDLAFFDRKLDKKVCDCTHGKYHTLPHKFATFKNQLLIMYIEWKDDRLTVETVDVVKDVLFVHNNTSGITVGDDHCCGSGTVPVITVDWYSFYHRALTNLHSIDNHYKCGSHIHPTFEGIDFILRSKAIEFAMASGDYTLVIDLWKKTFLHDPNCVDRQFKFDHRCHEKPEVPYWHHTHCDCDDHEHDHCDGHEHYHGNCCD